MTQISEILDEMRAVRAALERIERALCGPTLSGLVRRSAADPGALSYVPISDRARQKFAIGDIVHWISRPEQAMEVMARDGDIVACCWSEDGLDKWDTFDPGLLIMHRAPSYL